MKHKLTFNSDGQAPWIVVIEHDGGNFRIVREMLAQMVSQGITFTQHKTVLATLVIEEVK